METYRGVFSRTSSSCSWVLESSLPMSGLTYSCNFHTMILHARRTCHGQGMVVRTLNSSPCNPALHPRSFFREVGTFLIRHMQVAPHQLVLQSPTISLLHHNGLLCRGCTHCPTLALLLLSETPTDPPDQLLSMHGMTTLRHSKTTRIRQPSRQTNPDLGVQVPRKDFLCHGIGKHHTKPVRCVSGCGIRFRHFH